MVGDTMHSLAIEIFEHFGAWYNCNLYSLCPTRKREARKAYALMSARLGHVGVDRVRHLMAA